MKLAQKFIHAVKEGDLKALRKVVRNKGFDPDILFRFEGGMEKMSALHYAAKEGMTRMVRELLALGCDANLVTPFENATPLYLACQSAHRLSQQVVVQELLSHGAEVNCGNVAQHTPLIVACELGDLELVRTLLFYGADMGLACLQDELPDGRQHALLSRALTPRETDDLCDPYRGNTALMQACREHHFQVVAELLSRCCDVRAVNAAGNTALHLAAKSEPRVHPPQRPPVAANLPIAHALMRHGSPLDARNRHGDTPLKRALDGLFEIAVWNIPIEFKIRESQTFLSVAKALLEAGCSASLIYEGGLSALHCLLRSDLLVRYDCQALERAVERCVCRLVAAGCPVDAATLERAQKALPVSTRAPLLDMLAEATQRPPNLKQLAKWRLRQLCAQPLMDSLPHLGLPPYLLRYVSLEVYE